MATPSFGSGAAIEHGQEGERTVAAGSTPSHAEIERRAYFLYLEEGGGDPDEHWRRAEAELGSAGRPAQD